MIQIELPEVKDIKFGIKFLKDDRFIIIGRFQGIKVSGLYDYSGRYFLISSYVQERLEKERGRIHKEMCGLIVKRGLKRLKRSV